MRNPRSLALAALVALPLLGVPLVLGVRTAFVHAEDEDEDDKPETPAQKAEREKREAKAKKVRRFLRASGQVEIAKIQIEAMCAQFEKADNLPPGFAAKFKELVKPKDLAELAVPGYSKLSDEDLEAVTAFYETEAGKRVAGAAPEVARETAAAAEGWGQAMGMKVALALQDEKKGKKPAKPAPKDKDKNEDY